MSSHLDDPEFVEPLEEKTTSADKNARLLTSGSESGSGTGSPPPRRRRQYRLNQLMLVSVVFAIVFYFIGQAVRSGHQDDAILAGLVCSLVISIIGIMLLTRSTKYTWLSWIVEIIGLFGLAGLGLGWLSFVPVVIFVMSISHIIARYRAMQQDALLWAIALASDRSMPLAPAVASFGRQLGRSYRKKAKLLSECLENGMPLPEAFEFVDNSASPPAMVLARVGWDSGALPFALRMATSDRISRGSNSRDFGPKLTYLSLMLVAIQGIVFFLMYFIIPKFEAIFRDFGINLPPLTLVVIEAAHWVTQFGIAPFLFLLQIALLIYLPFAINGWGSLSIPLVDRLFIRRHRLLILRAMTVVVESGHPIPLGLLSLSRSYPTPWVRRRLAGAWTAIENGHGWADAMRAYGLLSTADMEVVAAAERLGNLNWAVRELAETGERRYAQRLELLTQIFFVLMILAAGLLIGLLAVAYFLPLIDLISRLSG